MKKFLIFLLACITIPSYAFTDIRKQYPYWFYKYLLEKENLFSFLDEFLKPVSVFVYKGKRKMLLCNRYGVPIKKFYVSLGRNPAGKKEKEWDGKTPEGFYFIEWRNRFSDFYLSLKISYPNFEDKLNAYVKGYNPGDYVMIHGFPNWAFLYPWYQKILKYTDWTNGCIAVSNEEIKEIWDLVDDFTPIIIKP